MTETTSPITSTTVTGAEPLQPIGASDLEIFDFWLGLILLATVACVLVYGVFDTKFALARSQGAAAISLLRRNIWRLWILIAGTAVILVGVLLSPLPVPGFTVLAPIGLAILASEFAWAARLTFEIKRHSAPIQNATWKVASRTPRWTVIPVCIVYWCVPIALVATSTLPSFIVWPASSIFFTPVMLWAALVIRGEPMTVPVEGK
jgi:hypothetical protein